MRVSIFVPCFIDQLYPQSAINMVTVLRKLGVEVDYNPNQTCCGQPAFNAGYVGEATQIAEKFLDDFEMNQLIVCPSASCVGFVRNHYKEILKEKYAATFFDKLSDNVFEFTEFLIEKTDYAQLQPSYKAKAMYHDSCSALRECQIKEGPRTLLGLVEGLELLENEKYEECCGFGGTFAVKFEPISTAMAEKKVQAAIDLGADHIISTDLSCLMHLQGYIDKHQIDIKTLHIADVLI